MTETPDKARQEQESLRDERGRFKKGISGNPSGTRKGSRHRATLAAQALLDGESEELTRKVIELAKTGDMMALKICIERILPIVKDKPIPSLKLPKMEVCQDAVKAMEAVLKALQNGELTPSEATAVGGLIGGFVKTLEITDLEKRLTALEDIERR